MPATGANRSVQNLASVASTLDIRRGFAPEVVVRRMVPAGHAALQTAAPWAVRRCVYWRSPVPSSPTPVPAAKVVLTRRQIPVAVEVCFGSDLLATVKVATVEASTTQAVTVEAGTAAGEAATGKASTAEAGTAEAATVEVATANAETMEAATVAAAETIPTHAAGPLGTGLVKGRFEAEAKIFPWKHSVRRPLPQLLPRVVEERTLDHNLKAGHPCHPAHMSKRRAVYGAN